MLLAVRSSFAQTENSEDALKHYEQQFQQGEKDINFIKKYIELLTKNKEFAKVNKLADSYLLGIPLENRYKGEYLKLFISNINSIHNLSFKELMNNWEIIKDPQAKKELEKKVHDTYLKHLNNFTSKFSSEGIIDNNYSFGNMEENILKLRNTDILYPFLKIAKAAKVNNIRGMIDIFNTQLIEKNYKPTPFAFTEKGILNTYLSIILENCDKKQCKIVLDILQSESEKGNKTFSNRIDEFKGRMMFLDMDNAE